MQLFSTHPNYLPNEPYLCTMRVIDLFSGCGGMSLGFQNAGFEIVAAFDNWRPAVSVYRANFEEHPIFEKDLAQDIDFIAYVTPLRE